MITMKSFITAFAVLAFSTAALSAAPAETLPSGVKVVHTTDGTGPQPKASDTVKVHYRGTLADGKEFDSSYKRGAPATFPLNRVVPCWTEGVQKNQGRRQGHADLPARHGVWRARRWQCRAAQRNPDV